MGMYTELVLKAEIRKSATQEAKDILEFLFGDGIEPTALPDHPFFSCERWRAIGNMSSYYHVPETINVYREGYIFSRSDLKDYADEIDLFMDWAKSYIEPATGLCYGWKWYEEADQPTMLMATEAEVFGYDSTEQVTKLKE